MKELRTLKNELEAFRKIQNHLAETNPSVFSPNPDLIQSLDRFGDMRTRPLFITYFHTIPHTICQDDIDNDKAYQFLMEHYQKDLKNHCFEISVAHDGQTDNEERYCFLYEDLIIHFGFNDDIKYYFYKTNITKVEAIINDLSQFLCEKEEEGPEINLLVSTKTGLDTKSLPLTRPKLDIASNYNDDFLPIHETIYQRLSQQNDKGLVLLHGKPGTGKTSYVRFLATSLKKEIIFLPPDMASAITNPDLLSLLMDHRNSILVIEDAEKIIVDRDVNGYSPVSALLNLADGLLSDCLNIQIICSFNTDLAKVDKALLRKGRLIARYEFTELATHKAQRLSDELGFTSKITKPTTLTDIFNQDEADFHVMRKMNSIGFKAG